MKILITGYTTRMFGSYRLRGDYTTFSYILEDILKDMGHEVDRKKVLVGDTLTDEYDFAFIGLAPLSSMSAARVCETHYALELMRRRACLFADDWSFCDYGSAARYTLDRWEKYLQYKKFPYTPEVIEQTKNSLEMLVTVNEGNNPPILAPMFPWGNHKLLMYSSKGEKNIDSKLITVDPSAWVTFPTISVKPPSLKTRQWLMAALSDHTPWIKRQKFKLPVKYIGNKKLGGLLPESEAIQLFSDSYGVLSTGYPSAGSGWWRTRYLNAAWAETLIYSDAKDAATMGICFQGDASYFENISSNNEYLELVEAQRLWLDAHISSPETVKKIVERVISK